MKTLAAITALSLLASTAAFAQGTSPSEQSQGTQSQQTTSEAQQQQLSPQFVRQIQMHLRQQGYYDERPTGQWDQDTVQALQSFQSDHDLPSNGQLDGRTIIALMRGGRLQQQGMNGQGFFPGEGMSGSSIAPGGGQGGALAEAYERGFERGFQRGLQTSEQEIIVQPGQGLQMMRRGRIGTQGNQQQQE